ncbi:MAG TPA: MerR family DNA-binding protein, partial [Jiangellaceae bacterium]|nr:MerR family DNA-binding protein [Jiangellaceae bacterium]
AAQTMGFSLGEVKEIVACWDRGDPICEPVIRLIETRLRELSDQIANLSKARNDLVGLLREAQTAPAHPKGICHAIERVGGQQSRAVKASQGSVTPNRG